MVYIYESNKTLADGTKVTYLYLAHNTRKNGVTVKEWMIPLGKRGSNRPIEEDRGFSKIILAETSGTLVIRPLVRVSRYIHGVWAC